MDPKPSVDPSAIKPTQEPGRLARWFQENWGKLLFVLALLYVVLRYLHPVDLLLAGGGLSLVIFLHELGHFVAAKLCDVHVKTFSIGFGPALPFCQFRYGETEYKLAMVPLGGYVAMVGEGEDEEADGTDAETEDAEPEAANQTSENPRSFKNKTVLQRMFIISAGVIMNLLLGCACFVAAYLNGVQELPAIIAQVESGSAAWQAGLHSGTEIKKINGRDNPWFDDVRPIISSTSRGETISLEVEYEGKRRELPALEPLKPIGALYPQLGIIAPDKLELRFFKRDTIPPFRPGSPAAHASGPEGGFQQGDRIVAMTDPDNPDQVTEIQDKPNGLPGQYFDYQIRLQKLSSSPELRGRDITFLVKRRGSPKDADPVKIIVPPAFHQDVGLRMRIGPVTAIRADSPAEKAGVQAERTESEDNVVPGDRIVEVELPEADGTITRFVAGATNEASPDTNVSLKLLDPLRLPYELNLWADRRPDDAKVKLTVLRERDHTEKREELELEWDHSYRYDNAVPTSPSAPLPISGLGLAYTVQSVVDSVANDSPAATAGIQPNDRIVKVRYQYYPSHDSEPKLGSWEELQPYQWAFADYKLQRQPPHVIEAVVEREGKTEEVELQAVPDQTWALTELGIDLTPDTRIQKASGIVEALEMGAQRTVRMVRNIYLGLYSIVFGRISVQVMSGPITLARASYLIAGQDVWALILWIGLISVNLAVINFLPIPVLDGGHMVFLFYEWIVGKRPPEGPFIALTWLGLAIILALMLFVSSLDIWRIFFR